MRENPTIGLTIQGTEHECVVEVEDTSGGLAEEPLVGEEVSNLYVDGARKYIGEEDTEVYYFGRHELTPYRDVSIVNADDLERTDDDQRIRRYVQKGLPSIPCLWADWEGLREEATPIDHLWNKEWELIQTHAEKAAELFQSQNFFSTI
ncbi:hypothetical protein scyTo_0000917 [Scyliorhinus torazame]|uniref:Uncharacterized protein n=1 Tax=Scyliorhinus torazame TaxID=75743 RepID=A0A401P650_SCYTO|nr:hypothetical protein [Scyliorhinus torazame]